MWPLSQSLLFSWNKDLVQVERYGEKEKNERRKPTESPEYLEGNTRLPHPQTDCSQDTSEQEQRKTPCTGIAQGRGHLEAKKRLLPSSVSRHACLTLFPLFKSSILGLPINHEQ
jgi:hypothetical protein